MKFADFGNTITSAAGNYTFCGAKIANAWEKVKRR